LEIKELDGSEIEVSGEIPVTVIESHRKNTIKKITKNLELPGFRKGKVPEDIAVKHIGEEELLKEIAETVIGQAYSEIVMDNKLDVVGRPVVNVTKLAPGNPIGFKIRSAVFPKVELPDYKKISADVCKKHEKTKDIKVTDKDVDDELLKIKKAMEASDENSDKESKKEIKIDDDFAKGLGNFKDLKDLKEKIKKQMLFDKQNKEKEKLRLAIADAIIAKAKLDVPNIFIEGEIDQMLASFKDRVSRAGMNIEDYLKQVGKSVEDLRKEWRADAEKRAKLQIILNEIANKEAILPDLKKLEMEVEHIKEHYPEAEKEAVRTYVKTQMMNEKVFEMLEGKDVATVKDDKTEKEDDENKK
jgi:trigger factor